MSVLRRLQPNSCAAQHVAMGHKTDFGRIAAETQRRYLTPPDLSREGHQPLAL
jgi:hypothetical protein